MPYSACLHVEGDLYAPGTNLSKADTLMSQLWGWAVGRLLCFRMSSSTAAATAAAAAAANQLQL
jgi:hypothetical protein